MRDLRPIDGDFMRCLFKDNIPLAEFVLRIITGKQDLTMMAERTRYLKENPKGVQEMCKVMEDMRNETLKEGAINSAKRMLKDGLLTLEKIAEYAGLPLDEVKKLKAE